MNVGADKAHWAWTRVNCCAQGRVGCAPPSVGDTEDYARKRAERIHAKTSPHRCGPNACGGEDLTPAGCIRVDKVPSLPERKRLDETLTAKRYDEIVKLRMLILDLIELDFDLDTPISTLSAVIAWRNRAAKMAKTWGKKGDCA